MKLNGESLEYYSMKNKTEISDFKRFVTPAFDTCLNK